MRSTHRLTSKRGYPDELIAKLSTTGTMCIYTLTRTHIIIDVAGHNGS